MKGLGLVKIKLTLYTLVVSCFLRYFAYTNTEIINKELEDKLGTLEVDLDARFALIRTQETNIGRYNLCLAVTLLKN